MDCINEQKVLKRKEIQNPNLKKSKQGELINLNILPDCLVIDIKANFYYVNSEELENIQKIKIIHIFKTLYLNNKVNFKDLEHIQGKVICDKDMSGMFKDSQFNQPLNSWDVSNVTNMSHMFDYSEFNQSLDSWDVSNVTNMENMFFNSKFNQNINSWDL